MHAKSFAKIRKSAVGLLVIGALTLNSLPGKTNGVARAESIDLPGVSQTVNSATLSASVTDDVYTPRKRSDGNYLVFPVISDLQMGNRATDAPKFEQAMDQLRTLVPDYDAIAIAGDLTEHGAISEYDSVMNIFNRKKVPSAANLFVIGNHEYINGLTPQLAQDRFEQKTGTENYYYDKWINGFHFIMLGTEDSTRDGKMSDAQIAWLEQKLAENADPNKPIFVFHHQHIKDTVYGSDLWGYFNTKLYNALSKYPQVVTFTGHSHYPIDDPRSIHQQDFTSLGTSAISYPELEPGKIQGNFPDDHIMQGLIVEVQDGQVVIKRRDFHANKWTGEDYVVRYPADKSKFTYTNSRDQVKPAFPVSAHASVDPSSIQAQKVKLKFDQATDNLMVHSYEINMIKADTNVQSMSLKAFSEWYYDPVPSSLSLDIAGLRPNTPYRAEIWALDSFNNRSDTALTTEFRTAPAASIDEMAVIDIDFADGTGKDRSTAHNDAVANGSGATIVYSNVFKKYVGRMNGTNDQYFRIAPSDSIKQVVGEFTLEADFIMNAVRNQAIFGNTESGGLSFESTSGGNVELWAYIDGAYKRIGVTLSAGIPYHLAATYDGTQIVLYLNGQKVKTLNATGQLKQPNMNFAIGADPSSGNKGGIVLNGDVSVARLFSTALTADEVQKSYQEQANRMAITEFDQLYADLNQARALADNPNVIGSSPGQYPQAAMEEYRSEIVRSTGTFQSWSTTKEQAVNAIASLQAAKTLLDSRKNQAAPTLQTISFDALSYEVQQGQSTPVKVKAQYSDGTNQDVTAASVLQIGNTLLATLTNDTISGVSQGETVVTATYGGKQASASIKVIAATPQAPYTTLTGSSSVQGGQPLEVAYGVNNVAQQAYAEDITLTYDPNVMEFVSVEPVYPNLSIVRKTNDGTGKIRLITASQGAGHAVTGNAQLLKLTFNSKVTSTAITTFIEVTDTTLGNELGNEFKALNSSLSVQVTPIPAGTPGDLNNDGKVSIGDLGMMAANYGKNTSSPDWASIKHLDFNNDGEIEISDLAFIASKMVE
ncbi:LamG-like jellyroll fold domain-containing protein [Paenibacillus sp. P36]|uniref:LamG-like jellyroll fold domain-containing protein n=1 Tax=Paenibacillus sp. P36 TaxID=3342538 RepID=UPI0038B3A6D6